LKILHISALPVWSMDGKGGMPSLCETLNGHVAGGHEILLVLPRFDPFSDDESPLFIPADQGMEFFFAACHWVIPFKRLRRFAYKVNNKKALPFFWRWVLNMTMFVGLTMSLALAAIMVRYKTGFKPHLVYAHNQYAALAGFLVSRLWKVPNVTRLYGTFLADLMMKPLVSLRYPTATAGFLVPSNLLICANDGTRGDEVARKFGISERRFRFWQNGVEPPAEPPQVSRYDLVRKFPQLRVDSVWIFSCSRLSYWKRIDRMLKALAVSKKEGVDCQLVVAGDGPEKDKLCGLARDLGISDAVVWLGAIPHDDIWALMSCADIFMLTNDVTNRCNPLYEAAWAGLPVVSVYDPSTADLLRHQENALLAAKDDHVALGQCLVSLSHDERLKAKLAQAQKELSRTFWSWEERMQVEVRELEKMVSSPANVTEQDK